MNKDGIYTIIYKEDKEYPETLLQLSDPPKCLYCLGDVSLLKNRCIGIVGSRKFSEYGLRATCDISQALAKGGITIVSGMARGVDSAAHKSALEVDGKTIAVLGCGIDQCYPAGNWKLKDEMASKGLVISEYPPGVHGAKWTFPRRNRIIAALSEMIIVTEAGLNSGSLITAELAMEMSKEVVVVPASIFNPYGVGGNQLIADGAQMALSINDILETAGVSAKIVKEEEQLSKEEREILDMVRRNGEMTVDSLARHMNLKISRVNGFVTVLEMKGFLKTSLGRVFLSR